MAKKKHTLTLREEAAVYDLLKLHMQRVSEDVAYYIGDYSDERIGREATPPQPASSVASIRRRVFGNFPAAPKAGGEVAAAEIEALKARVAALEARLDRLDGSGGADVPALALVGGGR